MKDRPPTARRPAGRPRPSFFLPLTKRDLPPSWLLAELASDTNGWRLDGGGRTADSTGRRSALTSRRSASKQARKACYPTRERTAASTKPRTPSHSFF